MDASLYLFDDGRARAWQPFSLTRPVGELLFGCLRLRERTERALGVSAAGHLVGDALAGFDEPGAPPVVAPHEVGDDRARVLLSSRVVLEPGEPLDTGEAATLTVDGQVVGWTLPAGHPMPPEPHLLDPEAAGGQGRHVEVRATVLGWPWHLVEANADRVTADLGALHRASSLFGLTGVHIVGDPKLSLGQGAAIEPGVVVDTREGPVRLDDGVYVQAPARIAGPLYVALGTHILGGSVGRSTIGPACKVRGEVDSSVLLGYGNKAHDGYLGHALVGEWVNLGALTTNSDLKNNYSPVRVRMQAGEAEVDTGLLKVGCFLGDHVKTGIGTLLTTGAVVGAGSNLFGGGTAPRCVPPFSWGAGEALVPFELERFLQTAEASMGRRDRALTPGARELLRRAWERTHGERG